MHQSYAASTFEKSGSKNLSNFCSTLALPFLKLEKIEIDYNTLISITILQNRMENQNQNQSQEMQMIQINGIDAYYVYDGEKYAPTFPLELAKNFKSDCGPKECENCHCFARWNGVMIGLCSNCACHYYNYEYGPGFIAVGCELNETPKNQNGITAFGTYLKDVDLDTVGDKNICDSKNEIIIENEIYWKRYEDDCPDEYGVQGSSYPSGGVDSSAGYDSY